MTTTYLIQNALDFVDMQENFLSLVGKSGLNTRISKASVMKSTSLQKKSHPHFDAQKHFIVMSVQR